MRERKYMDVEQVEVVGFGANSVEVKRDENLPSGFVAIVGQADVSLESEGENVIVRKATSCIAYLERKFSQGRRRKTDNEVGIWIAPDVRLNVIGG